MSAKTSKSNLSPENNCLYVVQRLTRINFLNISILIKKETIRILGSG